MHSINNVQKEFKSIYKIQKVVCFKLLKQDWAILELDQEIVDRKPLELDLNSPPKKAEELYMLGHPSGLSMKITTSGEVKTEGNHDNFKASIDAFRGNSGSPVLSVSSRKVKGILVAGQEDYVVDPSINQQVCFGVPEGLYETCQRIYPFALSIIDYGNIGLVLEGTCPTTKKVTYLQKGFGKFDIGKESVKSICQCCNKVAQEVFTLNMIYCSYTYIGIDENEDEQVETDIRTQIAVKKNLDKWKFFSIEVKRL